jgi:DNA invertase Pin-like site-specific DNA recombinase
MERADDAGVAGTVVVSEGVAYVRVSSARQEQGISLTTQRDAIMQYAKSHGITIVHEYCDVLSGTRDDRPRYQKMLSEIKPGQFCLVWRIDRIGRKKSELFRFFEYAKQHHIAVISVTQPELSNELVRDIMSVLAAYESQQIADRVRPNLTRGVEDGKWMSRIPKWYAMGPDGHLVPTEDAWQAEECWRLFLRTGNRNLTAAAFGLGRRQLWWMMRSPVYVGAIPWLDTVREGAHPAIVERATWEAARALLESRRTGKRRERADSALLVGFIFVADTDRRMSHKPARSKNHAYRYYATDPDYSHRDPRHVVNAERAEAAVLDWLRGLAITRAERRAIERAMRDAARADPHKRARAAVERRIAVLAAEQVNTARMAARGELAGPVWEGMRREQAAEMTAQIARRDALPPVPDPKAAAPLLDLRLRLRERIDAAAATGNVAALRLLVEAFIVRVEVWNGESPRLKGGAARRYWLDHPPEIRVVPVPLIGGSVD